MRSLLLFVLCVSSAPPLAEPLVMGSKNFTENRLLGEILAQLIEAHTDIPVERRLNLGGTTLGRYSAKRLFLIERNRIWLVAKLFPLRMWPLTPYYFLRRAAAMALAAPSILREAST